MIQSISIENFRCFEKTEIKGFGRMNLITGKNNSGKTCLLEALYFSLSGDENIINLRNTINGKNKQEAFKDSLFRQNDNYLDFYFRIEETLFRERFNTQTLKFETPVSDGSFAFFNNREQNLVKLIIDKDKQIPESNNLVKIFDDLQIRGLHTKVLEAVQIIDSNIEDIRSFATYPTILFIKRNGNKDYQPLSFFGDALQKIVRYVSAILSFGEGDSTYKYLLIDEIENGIHYTAQKEVWQMLFKLCKHYSIQLFATTHSLEMIKAFEEVCEEFQNEGAYFELARQAKSNQIIGIKHQISTLEYELETNANIRGE